MTINGHNLPDKVNVLGTEYKIFYAKREDDERFEDCNGYCEEAAKELHISSDLFENSKDNMKDLYLFGFKVIRHEIVHAFFEESGLSECCDWAINEEVVDWIAKQFPKMSKCFKSIGVDE